MRNGDLLVVSTILWALAGELVSAVQAGCFVQAKVWELELESLVALDGGDTHTEAGLIGNQATLHGATLDQATGTYVAGWISGRSTDPEESVSWRAPLAKEKQP